MTGSVDLGHFSITKELHRVTIDAMVTRVSVAEFDGDLALTAILGKVVAQEELITALQDGAGLPAKAANLSGVDYELVSGLVLAFHASILQADITDWQANFSNCCKLLTPLALLKTAL
jgi:hypothetical protein